MRKNIFNKFLSVVLSAAMVLSLAACGSGQEGAGGNAGTSSNSKVSTNSSTQGNSGQKSSDNGDSSGKPGSTDKTNSDEKAEITLYLIDGKAIAILITGSACETVAASRDSDIKKEFCLVLDGGQSYWTFQYDNSYGELKNGSLEFYPYTDAMYGNNVCGADMYLARWDESESGSLLNKNGDYVLRIKEMGTDMGSGAVVAEGKTADIIKTATEEDYLALSRQALSGMTASASPKAPWEGTYAIEHGNYFKTGTITAESTTGGLIHFLISVDDINYEFYAEEKEYDEAKYAYGTYITAKATPVMKGLRQDKPSMVYSSTPDGTSIKFTISDNDRDIYVSEIYEYFLPWHTAPANYEDRDVDGYLTACDISTEPFKPRTNDYTLCYETGVYFWDGSDNFVCNTYTLKSYDINGHLVQTVTRYDLESESQANKALAYYKNTMSEGSEAYAKGNLLFLQSNPYDSYAYTKYDTLIRVNSEKWYVGCHYTYDDNYFESDYKRYLYASKPLTKDDFDVSIDDVVYWKNANYRYHRSLDNDVNTLVSYFTRSEINLRENGLTPIKDMYFWDAGFIKLHGRTAESCAYQGVYAGNNKYDYYITFTEYEFGDGIATVTDYFYKVDDIFNHDLTFANYKSRTPEATLTQRYDMTSQVW